MFAAFSAGILVSASAQALEIRNTLYQTMIFLHEENYGFDLDWERQWLNWDSGLMAGAGSITSDRFRFDLTAKFRVDTGSPLFFGYRYEQKGSFLWDRKLHLADLGLTFGPLSAGITGMAESKKEFNVAGLMMAVDKGKDKKIDARFIWPAIWFNSKTQSKDRYRQHPFQIRFNGIWRLNGLILMGDLNFDKKWILESENSVQRHGNADGRLLLVMKRNANEWNIKLSGRNYCDELSFKGNNEYLKDRFRSMKMMLGWRYSFSNAIVLSSEIGGVRISGRSTDKKHKGLSSVPIPFAFRRHDEIMKIAVAKSSSRMGQWKAGMIGGTQTMNPGESRTLEPREDELHSKVFLEYSKCFHKNLDILMGVSYNMTEVRFGGGNLRLRARI